CGNLGPEYILADLPVLLVEFFGTLSLIKYIGLFNQWSTESSLCYSFLAWFILACLALEALLRIGSILLYLTRKVSEQEEAKSGDEEHAHPQPHNVLFGDTLWKANMVGESSIITIPRGMIALAFITFLFFSSFLDIVLYPVRQAGVTPTSDLRSSKVPGYIQVDPPIWGVVFVKFFSLSLSVYLTALRQITPLNAAVTTLEMDDWNQLFERGVTVTPLWDNSGTQNQTCIHVPEASHQTSLDFPANSSININKVICPPRVAEGKGTLLCIQTISQFTLLLDDNDGSDSPIFSLTTRDAMPDLLISVNFTTLQISVDQISDLFDHSIQVMVAFSDDVQQVTLKTEATALFPGTNTIGSVTWDLRQISTTNGLSTFGMFDSSETFLVSRMLSVVNDPLAGRSALIPSSPEISTFRISFQTDISEMRLLKDSRSQTVIGGVAQVGGLWTSLSGIFAVIFGCSLLGILLGSKKMSLLGIVHCLQHDSIRNACHEKYPDLPEQIGLLNKENGLISLLCDHLLDVDFLKGSPPTSTAKQDGHPGST
ncbi:hypothetical protein CVT26_006412, partial [Gymnopilus dilepis]